MAVRDAKGHYVSDDSIARYILERHNAVLRALVARTPANDMREDADLLELLGEASAAIPTLDEQRGRAEEELDAFTRSIENAGPK